MKIKYILGLGIFVILFVCLCISFFGNGSPKLEPAQACVNAFPNDINSAARCINMLAERAKNEAQEQAGVDFYTKLNKAERETK